MLVLTRKVGERILIGNDVKVLVTEISGDRIKIGIEAPRNILVIREELLTPKQSETENHAS